MLPRRLFFRLLSVAVFLGVLAAGWLFRGDGSSVVRPSTGPASDGVAAVERAFAERRSNLEVTLSTDVERLLPDDRKGTPHQRFLIRLPSGLSVLVAHNLELAPRVPLAAGDSVEIGGEYEWNEKGGVLHWTHHDPRGRRPGGFIRHRGREYR